MARAGGLVLATDIEKTASFIHWARKNSLYLAVVGYGQLKRSVQLDREFAGGLVFGKEAGLVFLTDFFDLGACIQALSDEMGLIWHHDFTQLENIVDEEKYPIEGMSRGVTLSALEYLDKNEFWHRLSRQLKVAFVGSGAEIPSVREAQEKRRDIFSQLFDNMSVEFRKLPME